jgi:hypothetical protein
MKIEEVQAICLFIPTRKTGPQVPFVWGTRAMVIVEVKTEDGLTGYGEAFGYGTPQAVSAVVNHTLKPLLIGQDATAINSLVQMLFQKTHLWGRYGITTFAISGVEIALWDLAGKRAGKPLFELLGGAATREVPAYASLVRYEEGDEQIAQHARPWRGRQSGTKYRSRSISTANGPPSSLLKWQSPWTSTSLRGWKSRSGRRRIMPVWPPCRRVRAYRWPAAKTPAPSISSGSWPKKAR